MSEYLTTAEAAELAGITPDTLRSYAWRGQAPEPRRFGRSLMWRRSVFERWLATRPGQGYRSDLRR